MKTDFSFGGGKIPLKEVIYDISLQRTKTTDAWHRKSITN